MILSFYFSVRYGTPLLNADEWEELSQMYSTQNPYLREGINSNGESSSFSVNSQVPENSQVPANSQVPVNRLVPVNNQATVSTYNFNPLSYVFNTIVPAPEVLAEHVHNTPFRETSENSFLGINTVDHIDIPSRIRSLNEITTIENGRAMINISLNADYPVNSIPNPKTSFSCLPPGYERMAPPRQVIPGFS
jgi:hypothetical protein